MPGALAHAFSAGSRSRSRIRRIRNCMRRLLRVSFARSAIAASAWTTAMKKATMKPMSEPEGR